MMYMMPTGIGVYVPIITPYVAPSYRNQQNATEIKQLEPTPEPCSPKEIGGSVGIGVLLTLVVGWLLYRALR